MFEEGSLLKWNWTKDLSSTRVAKLNSWQIEHDHWLYSTFKLIPPKAMFDYKYMYVLGDSCKISLDNSQYSRDIPLEALLRFERVDCKFGKLQSIRLTWGSHNYGGCPDIVEHRTGNLPAVIRIDRDTINCKYYYEGLEHDQKQKYYGFDCRVNQKGTIEIECPECHGEGERVYMSKTHRSIKSAVTGCNFSFVEEEPYEDKCHMCTLPLEKKGRGWVEVNERNSRSILELAKK
jgi:hypothetical protein